MRGLSTAYDSAVAQIDGANADDPTVVVVRGESVPLALVHGRLAAEWVERLVDTPTDAELLAARAHHLRRWEMPRTSYPEGRPGYLRWRKDQKARHAGDLATIMESAGYDADVISRTQALVRREGLGSDPQTQVIEDAACLVFIETQLADVADRFARDHLLAVIRKTAAKMSPEALALIADIRLSPEAVDLLGEALSG